MRSGDPGPDRPRERRESPDLSICSTRIVPERRGVRGTMPLLFYASLVRSSASSLWPSRNSAVNESFPRGCCRSPRLRRHALPEANVARACRPAAPPPARGHRRAAQFLSAFPNSFTTPPQSTVPQRNLCRPTPQIALLQALGGRLVGHMRAPLGWRIVFREGMGQCHI